MINLNYTDFMTKCRRRKWCRIHSFILMHKYDEYDNLKAKLYRLLKSLL